MGHKRVKIGASSRSGLLCPNCGSRKFLVVYVRHKDNETIFRRRACEHCGKRISTTERQI